jgi:catechol 2,3-dioxygenase-like lactoylglutathione lyase family enzyme
MTIQRMDNVLIVVDDLDAVIAFFVELGMELAGKGPIEGSWVERVIGIDEVRPDVAMLRTPLTCASGAPARTPVDDDKNHRGEKFEYQFHSHVRPASAENARL